MREMGLGLLLAVAVAVGAFLVGARPVAGRPIVAFFPAGSSVPAMASAVAGAGGRLLQATPGSSTITTIGEDASYPAALYRAGAWLVVDASVGALCAQLRSGHPA